jgi:MFS family permease
MSSVALEGGTSSNDKRIFWGSFIALIACAFGFVVRTLIIGDWAAEFGLSETEKGELLGVGFWPFAFSIFLFSLVIDKIGYGRAAFIGFVLHAISTIILVTANSYDALYWGTFLFALSNGTVEAYINPVVATMFHKEKAKWLNILHAGWPGGSVLAGIIAIAMTSAAWEYKVALTFIPTVIYGILLFGCKFPQSERVQAGISYREMLSDFGGLGAFLSVFLISIQIFDIAKPEGWTPIDNATYALIPGLIAGLAFGFSIKSLGQPIFFILCLLMIPLATTELGIDSWSAELLKPAMQDIGLEAGWVLVYTMGIMTVLRFFAGPIVHKITPLALLAGSAAVAAIGLVFLSKATAIGILAAATVYGLGKTFFWPTMLAVVAEKFPKGGALTLNSVGGVGMLGLGIGSLFLGQIQDESISTALIQKGEVYEQLLKEPESGVLGEYQALDTDKVAEATEAEQAVVEETQNTAKKDALMTAAIFPVIMFLSYVGLVLYYKSAGDSGPTSLLDNVNNDAATPAEEASTGETDNAGEVAAEEPPSDEGNAEAEEGGEE